MDDRLAEFLIAVDDLCSAASLASLHVEVRTHRGRHVTGVPRLSPRPAAGGCDPEATVRLGAEVLSLHDVAACTVHAPTDGA